MFERIDINPRVCNGHPVIRGTRIPVTVILEHLAAGESWETVQQEFPALAAEDIRAAIDFARGMIDHTEIVTARTN